MADRTAAETAQLGQLLAEGIERVERQAAELDHLDLLDAIAKFAHGLLDAGGEREEMAYALAGLALHVRRRGGDPRG